VFKDQTHGQEPEQRVEVVRSSAARLLTSFSRIEMVTFGIAGLAAIASGLLMFYVTNPVFGSLKDYLTVFLWALAIDQGKNALQIQQLFIAPQKAAASP
jgi:hypothetical protein